MKWEQWVVNKKYNTGDWNIQYGFVYGSASKRVKVRGGNTVLSSDVISDGETYETYSEPI